MSRIGKKPVDLPKGVDFQIAGSLVTVKGPKGSLQHKFADEVNIEMKDGVIHVTPINQSDKARSLWGLSRSLVRNMVEGVSKGYIQYLDINGIGFKAQADKKILTLTLGFSHEVYCSRRY
jgi:large subunit ribosomal protein L6